MNTIERINRAAGQQTFHPMICVVESDGGLTDRFSIDKTDFYALTIKHRNGKEYLHLSIPGEHIEGMMEKGVYFHPDLLFDTPLESRITEFPRICQCSEELSPNEVDLIDDCFGKIGEELRHPIDRYSATILSSHLNLLLNYCAKICN